MSKAKLSLCYPYTAGVVCICDGRGRIYKCFPDASPDAVGGLNGDHGTEALLSRDALESGDFAFSPDGDLVPIDRDRDRGLDERTEIILAATFLVLIVLAFVR